MIPPAGTRRPRILPLLAVCAGLGMAWTACAPSEDRARDDRWVEAELLECATGARTDREAVAGEAGEIGDAGGGRQPERTGAGEITFVPREDAFDHPAPPPWAPFDVLAADMEGDGDADLLMNFHNRGRLELHENDGGRFVLRNPVVEDRSGLFENPGIPSLYATAPEMNEKIRESGGTGVFLWHDPDRAGHWRVVVVPDTGEVDVRLRANRPLRVLGLADRHVTRVDEFEVRAAVSERVAFRVDVEFVSTGLEVSASVPVIVGPGLHRVEDGEVSLWKEDPHGMAWVDVRGSAGREIFITRGGLMGTLQPPHPPKVDRLYEYRGSDAGSSGTLYDDVRDSIPGDYGRGRRVAWVDVDGDLDVELYVGNTDSPNRLLVADGGEYRDVAAGLGLDLRTADAFAWLDVDDDGRDDLVFVGEGKLRVAFNQDGSRPFQVRRGAEIGLALPPAAGGSDSLFENLSLHVLDFDADGMLDLWLSGHGPELANVLFRNEGGRFSDATGRAGLAEVSGTISLAVADLDNDGYPDALATGETFLLLHNDRGRRFAVEPVGAGWDLPSWSRGVAADFDLDCRADLVLVGDRRVLLRNTGESGSHALQVLPRSVHGDAVGTLIRVVYSSGSVQAQRLGSAGSIQYSQGVAPLRFGVPEGTDVERVEVRWTDGRSETLTTFDEERGGRR